MCVDMGRLTKWNISHKKYDTGKPLICLSRSLSVLNNWRCPAMNCCDMQEGVWACNRDDHSWASCLPEHSPHGSEPFTGVHRPWLRTGKDFPTLLKWSSPRSRSKAPTESRTKINAILGLNKEVADSLSHCKNSGKMICCQRLCLY